jgi:drug/metabolite transporter (DMT)-like permease
MILDFAIWGDAPTPELLLGSTTVVASDLLSLA